MKCSSNTPQTATEYYYYQVLKSKWHMLCVAAAAFKEGALLISRALQCVSAGLQANTKTKHLNTHMHLPFDRCMASTHASATANTRNLPPASSRYSMTRPQQSLFDSSGYSGYTANVWLTLTEHRSQQALNMATRSSNRLSTLTLIRFNCTATRCLVIKFA
jgi:hypothetical protein